MRQLLAVLLLLSSAIVQAEVYKCVKGGQMAIQDFPCESGSTTARTIATQGDNPGWINWSLLKSGLSVAEVRRKIPNLEEGSRGRLVDGAAGMLRAEGVSMDGVLLDAELYFLAGRFLRINYATPMTAAMDNDVSLRNFEKLSATYRAKYGQESKRDVAQKSWGISADAEWRTERGRVYVSLSPLTGNTSRLLTGFVPK